MGGGGGILAFLLNALQTRWMDHSTYICTEITPYSVKHLLKFEHLHD